MNRPLKRLLATAGGLALGVAGAVAFSSPAQAHHTNLSAETQCATDGGWEVTWSVYNWNDGEGYGPGTITRVETDPELLDALGDSIYPEATVTTAGISETQYVPAEITEVTLTVGATWYESSKWDPKDEDVRDLTVTAPDGGCEKLPDPEPTPPATHAANMTCTGVAIELQNPENGEEATYTLTPSVGEPQAVTLAPGDMQSVEFLADESGLSVDVSLNGESVETVTWEQPEGCAEVDGVFYSTCDAIIFELENPEDGHSTTLVFTPSEGDEQTVTLEPGEATTVEIPASGDEFSLSVVLDDEPIGDVAWEQPEDCDEAAAPPEEKLPTTGSSTMTMISIAAGAALVGAVLFYLIRRRRAATTW